MSDGIASDASHGREIAALWDRVRALEAAMSQHQHPIADKLGRFTGAPQRSAQKPAHVHQWVVDLDGVPPLLQDGEQIPAHCLSCSATVRFSRGVVIGST